VHEFINNNTRYFARMVVKVENLWSVCNGLSSTVHFIHPFLWI